MYSLIERRILLIILFQWIIKIHCQLNLYNTDRLINFDYDCLYYRIHNEKLVYQDLSNIIDELIPYCFRPLNESDIFHIDFINLNDQIYSFEQLYHNNITSQQLLQWSAPIDLVENYQFYLNDNKSSLLKNELFYNCTKPWFGYQCEYSFDFTEEMSLNKIIDIEFSRKTIYYESSDSLIELPCYIHIPCDRGGSLLCLDWREICDGHIDCLNNGLDEAYCFDLEINECNENEYRCHNGLCIPEQYWENGLGESDCHDRSDEISDVKYIKSCYLDPRFRCEEHSCRTNWHEFSCGDGQCVQKFDKCHNKRHQLLIQTMIQQGNLTDQCWIIMICLTKFIHNEICELLLNNNEFILKYLQTCEDIFQFPIIPIHYGHLRLLYEKPYLKYNKTSYILPDYICYDEQLCDCIIPNFYFKNLTCINSSIVQIELNISGHPWIDLILILNSYFSSCLITHTYINKKIIYENSSAIYSCQNSSKLISKSRLIDQNKDCCMNDDETYLSSCLINDKYRIKCPNQTNLCLSSLLSIDDCPESINEYYNYIPFEIFCNGFIEHYFEDLNGKIYNDETDCNYWPCNNIYSRCDSHWLCSNGEDENNCHDKICPLGTHPCITPINYSLICLSSEKVGDNINDCLGGSDEVNYCRELYPMKKDYERFHCLNSDLCLSIYDLCDNIQTCPLGDDENFCQNSQFICNQNSLIENILCQHSEYKKQRQIYFSMKSSINYPSQSASTTNNNIIIKNQIKQNLHDDIKTIESRIIYDDTTYWYCNRGLPIRIRSKSNIYHYECLCPPSYYGNLCQYQNERISITLGLIKNDKYEIYTIILMLIDDNDKYKRILSYDQFDYSTIQSCGIKFNRYLLYSTRPKNLSKNYNLHISIFEKRTMTYRGNWHLSISFLFLPVNRLITLLNIPSYSITKSSKCLFKCENGECIKYINKDKYFCRCYSGWTGIQCDQEINCQICSLDSICIGSINKHSICICPLTKFGPRCLLSSSCENHLCKNNGQCIPTDISIPGSDYTCLCSDQFYGNKCQYKKSKLEISLDNLDIPSYLMAFLFTISNDSNPTPTIIIEKLTLFQHIVTFRISISYNIVIIKLNEKYYLAVVQEQYFETDIFTSINPTRECQSIENIFNSTLMLKPKYQRIKYYHILCEKDSKLNCFIDEEYLCLCTKEFHANCFEFKREKNLECLSKSYCKNQGYCLQDHPNCPSSIICVCPKCYFGSQCQYYAKGFGLTLDEILGYEIKHNLVLFQQTFSVKLTSIIIMIMFIIGLFNGILSIITFKNKICQEVGCGLYLLTSSITSLIIVILFTFKFWFLLLSYRKFFAQRFIIYTNCMFIEPILKIFLYIDNWLNASIAIERAFAVFKGIYFNKKTSKIIAKWIILFIILINIILVIPQLLYLHLYDDKKEERTWCVIIYSSSLHIYNTFLIFFHFLTPFFINLFSAIFIIIVTTQQRAAIQTEILYIKQLTTKLKQHKHLLISPIILIILSLPRLILTFTLNCQKSSKYFWLYLIGYFLSFMPSVFVFIIFVLPSVIFRKSFKQAMNRFQRRLLLLKLKFSSNKRI